MSALPLAAAASHSRLILIPTCTETGLTEGKHCSDCSEVFVKQEIIPAWGHDFVDGGCTRCGLGESTGLDFKLNRDGQSYSVVGIGTCTDTDLVIPSTFNDLPVTSIGDYAFASCYKLTSVIIPDFVTTIGEGAFYACDNLTNVTIGNSVTTISNEAFYNCPKLTSVTLPSSVTAIGKWAFAVCTNLTSIVVDKNNTAYQSIDGNLYSKDGTVLVTYA